ncbi:hypothetical protein P3S68_014234 [Capsicum galapagoense]
MSHLKNVLRLVGICLEFESPVMVYEYVEGIALSDLLYREEQWRCQNSGLLTVNIIASRKIRGRICCLWKNLLYRSRICHLTVTQKVDVYSFGILLFELLTGKEVREIMKSNIREGNVMDKMYSAISEETTDLEEPAKFNVEEDNVMNRVNSILMKD